MNLYSGDGELAIDAGMTPSVCTVDMAGDLYFYDISSSAIRVVNGTTGKISTFASVSKPFSLASDDNFIYYSATFSVGKFNKVTKVKTVYDSSVGTSYVVLGLDGSLYYSATSEKTIKKVDKQGAISIIAGQTSVGCGNGNKDVCGDGGLATSALFYVSIHRGLDPYLTTCISLLTINSNQVVFTYKKMETSSLQTNTE